MRMPLDDWCRKRSSSSSSSSSSFQLHVLHLLFQFLYLGTHLLLFLFRQRNASLALVFNVLHALGPSFFSSRSEERFLLTGTLCASVVSPKGIALAAHASKIGSETRCFCAEGFEFGLSRGEGGAQGDELRALGGGSSKQVVESSQGWMLLV